LERAIERSRILLADAGLERADGAAGRDDLAVERLHKPEFQDQVFTATSRGHEMELPDWVSVSVFFDRFA
jgi:hypothetical protein